MEIMSRQFVSIDQSQPVSQLIGKLDGGAQGACIVDGKSLVGIFDPQALLRTRVDIAEIKAARVAKAVPRLGPEDDLRTIARHFYEANATMLPVMRDGRILGVVYITDVLARIKEGLGSVVVRQIRHLRPITVRGSGRIDTALSLLHDGHIDRLPVVDDDGRMIGVISTKDVLTNYYRHHIERDNGQAPKSRTRAFRAESPDLGALPVSNFMDAMPEADVQSIAEDDLVTTAIDRMVDGNVLSLFILRDGVPEGIITTHDLLEAFIHRDTPEAGDIQYIGLDELGIDGFLKAQVRRMVSYNTARIGRYLDGEHRLTVHIKEYSRTGARHKFSVHLRLDHPGATVPACDAEAWDVRSAIQEAFKRLETGIDHRSKSKKGLRSLRKTGRQMPGEVQE